MNESEFNVRIDEVLVRIEEAIDASGAAIDSDTAGGILTLSFDNATKIIVNRQTPVRQIWVATRSGGFHYDYDDQRDAWVSDVDGELLFSALSRYCTEQADEPVTLG